MINMVRPVALTDDQLATAAAGKLDPHDIALGLKAAGIADGPGSAANLDLAGNLAAEVTEHAREALAQRGQRSRLDEAGQPCYELPLVTDGMDLAGLYRLAAALLDQGAA
jgi:hypothetical protein